MAFNEEIGRHDSGDHEKTKLTILELHGALSQAQDSITDLDNRLLSEQLRNPVDALELAYKMVGAQNNFEKIMIDIALEEGNEEAAVEYEYDVDHYENIMNEAEKGNFVLAKDFLISRAESNESVVLYADAQGENEQKAVFLETARRLRRQSSLIPQRALKG